MTEQEKDEAAAHAAHDAYYGLRHPSCSYDPGGNSDKAWLRVVTAVKGALK